MPSRCARRWTGRARGERVAWQVGEALQAYEAARRPQVESLQRAAQASLQWFEDTERYMRLPPLQFAFTLLTRSLRITHEDLRKRDPAFLGRVDRAVSEAATRQTRLEGPAGKHRGGAATDVHAVSAPRSHHPESDRGLTDVPVRG